jgi:DNA-binding response OmpR family regulator
VADIAVELTPTEWGLLLAFAGAPGKVFSRRELVLRVRGFEFDGYERTVDSHIKNLRRKLAELLADREVIETVVGLGYRFALRHDPS